MFEKNPHTMVSCPSCGSAQVVEIGPLALGSTFAGRVLEEPMPGGTLYRCEACALVFRHPLPTKDELDALYRRGDITAWQYESGKRPDWVLTQQWLAEHQPAGSVLDVGCYDGAFLDMMGAQWERYGIEIHEAAARRAEQRGVQIVGTDAAMLSEIEQRFDVVTAFDLIEHMPDPRQLLIEMKGLVPSGGLLIVGSGNADAASWRLMGSRYWYCTLPEHLAFISTSWCQKAADALGLALRYTASYSHAKDRTLATSIKESGKNLVYRFLPPLFRILRAKGYGGLDVAHHPELAAVPPGWMTAKDHVLAIFQKP